MHQEQVGEDFSFKNKWARWRTFGAIPVLNRWRIESLERWIEERTDALARTLGARQHAAPLWRRIGSCSAHGFCRWRGVAGCLIACGAIALSACQTNVAQDPKPRVVERIVETPKCAVREYNDRDKFATEAWGVPTDRFFVGQPLTLQMRVSSPAHVSLFHVSTSCKVTRLLHNHRLETPGDIIDFPLPESGIEITVKPPKGEEGFYFVATRQPLVLLAGSDVLKERGHIASLDMSPEQFYRRLEQARGRIDPNEWSIRTLRTQVVERY